MPDADPPSKLPDDIPDALVELLDTLDARQLRAVAAFVEARLAHPHAPTVNELEADSDGTIVDIAVHDTYTLVWRQPATTADDTPATSLYIVRKEPTPDGAATLHWTYLGNVQDAATVACEDCGTLVPHDTTTCPACGRDLDDDAHGGEAS